MTQDHFEPGRDHGGDVAAQREVTRTILARLQGFALAGSGAIRDHGVTDRPTEDVDLFTDSLDVSRFDRSVDQVVADLRGSGYEVQETRRVSRFARLHVVTSDGRQLDVDLGVDWRRDDPVRLDVGPVLSLADAVGNKVSALYSRAEARDYLDVRRHPSIGPVQRRAAAHHGCRTRPRLRCRYVLDPARCRSQAAARPGRPLRRDRRRAGGC